MAYISRRSFFGAVGCSGLVITAASPEGAVKDFCDNFKQRFPEVKACYFTDEVEYGQAPRLYAFHVRNADGTECAMAAEKDLTLHYDQVCVQYERYKARKLATRG